MSTHSRIATWIDRFSALTGRAIAWLAVLMVILTLVVVVMRYVFDAGLIWMQESVIWMHAVLFMLGAASTLQADQHVRVDVFYRSMSERRKALVDFAGVVLFLWPMCGFLAVSSWDFVMASWRLKEASREAGGLPYPLLPLLKVVLVLMPLTLSLQGLAIALRSLARLRGGLR
jgi:TRAP-type mannitol/chloroaromatic compound transport system permease small subunit